MARTLNKTTGKPATKKIVSTPIQSATLILQDYDGSEKNYIISTKPGEKNFVDAVGRFIYQHKLSPNHLIEKWDAESRTIKLIKFLTGKTPKTSGTCF